MKRPDVEPGVPALTTAALGGGQSASTGSDPSSASFVVRSGLMRTVDNVDADGNDTVDVQVQPLRTSTSTAGGSLRELIGDNVRSGRVGSARVAGLR